MIDEKSNSPPAYRDPYPQPQKAAQSPQPQQGPYTPPTQQPPQVYTPQQGQFNAPQQQAFTPPPQGVYQQQGSFGPQGGYPPQFPGAQPQVLSPGVQYQQQLFAMCAAGNHDVETKYGIAGIITAVLCFPIGLICLFADTEKRCVRCGSRVG